MARNGDELSMPHLGIRIRFLRTSEETEGEVVEYEVLGRPRGFLVQPHVHPSQTERQEVLAGVGGVRMDGREQLLQPGDAVTIPAGTPHRQYPAGSAEGRVRVELRPALRTEQLLERLAALDAAGSIGRRGFPRPLAGARLVRDFAAEGHATRPPVAVQRAVAAALLGVASAGDRRYVFVDEWDVDAPIEAVFSALADARSYPAWWVPVYRSVSAQGEAAVGQVSTQDFKGLLPYRLHTTSRIVLLEPPHRVAAEVDGDLRGDGLWTLTERPDGRVHVRFDWTVYADKPLLRMLTPVLRPAFRWNHRWAIARAMEGLEPYAQRSAASVRGAAAGGQPG